MNFFVEAYFRVFRAYFNAFFEHIIVQFIVINCEKAQKDGWTDGERAKFMINWL